MMAIGLVVMTLAAFQCDPRCHTRVASMWLFAVAAIAAICMWTLRPLRVASAEGFGWRDLFGRWAMVPWKNVAALSRHPSPNAAGQGHAVELSDGRVVMLPSDWSDADRLCERVAVATARGAYRTRRGAGVGALDDEVVFTFGAQAWRSAWWIQVAVFGGMLVAAGSVEKAIVWFTQDRGDVGAMLFFSAVLGVPFLVLPFTLLLLLWQQRRGWRPGAVVLGPSGIELRGTVAPLRVAWSEVLDVVDHGPWYARSTRVETLAGAFETGPGLDGPRYFRETLRKHLPAVVLDAEQRRAREKERLAPTESIPGVRRHHAHVRSVRSIALMFAALALAVASADLGVMLIPSIGIPLQGWSVLDTIAMGCGLAAIVALIGARTCRIDVSERGCVWRGLFRRRHFAWSDVARATLPDHQQTGLTLRLRDGTLLWCEPSLLADGDLLVESVATRTRTA